MSNLSPFTKLWPKVQPHTLLHEYKASSLYHLAIAAQDLDPYADMAECGVFRGGMSILLAKMLGEKQHLWAFDSFLGLPAPDPKRETAFYKKESLTCDQVVFERNLFNNNCRGSVIVTPGWFEDTLPKLPADIRFSLIHVDCDVYSAAATCIANLYDRMVPGGLMVFDDYFDLGGGVKRAVDEHLATSHEILRAGPIEQAYFAKGQTLATAKNRKCLNFIDAFSDGILVDISNLLDDKQYLLDLDSPSSAMADLHGSLENAEKIALKTLDVCRYHRKIVSAK